MAQDPSKAIYFTYFVVRVTKVPKPCTTLQLRPVEWFTVEATAFIWGPSSFNAVEESTFNLLTTVDENSPALP